MNDSIPPHDYLYTKPSLEQEFTLTSPSFADGGPIGTDYTCDGSNRAPILRWNGVPAATASFVLIVDDPDAPTSTPFVHWVVANIPATSRELFPLGEKE